MLRRLAWFLILVLALAACSTPITNLRVTSFSPGEGATGVSIDSVITATFNVDVAEASLDGNFVLNKGADVVAGAITYDDASRTATFTPNADLEYATVYTATVSGDIQTPTGASLSEEASWSFTTEADPTVPAETDVAIDQLDQTLAVGDDVQLSVTVTASGGASEDVSWSSDDDSIATVSATGLVEAVAVGTTTITATSIFDPSVSDSITVEVLAVGTGTAVSSLQGTYVSMTNLSVITPDFTSGTRVVEFDISWDESWRGALKPTWVQANDNWDATWVFVKYSVEGGPWEHATLKTSGHAVPAGAAIDTPDDGKGAFIYRDAAGYGIFDADGIGLVWDFAADGVDLADDVALRLFAVEMVYVPEGSFFLGSGSTAHGQFREGGTVSSPFEVVAQSSITLGDAAGQLYWTEGLQTGSPTGATDASFPTGFAAAYFMKYQLTQGQYVDFLNTVTQAQATTLKYTFAANPDFRYRYAVEGDAVGSYSTVFPYLPMNWINWAEGAAYADWAGLRPMTELEYEKAARGPSTSAPVVNAYAWGSTTIVAATSLLNAGTVDETPEPGNANAAYGDNLVPTGPVRVGAFAAPGKTREGAGASFYGLLELSGNLHERPVTVGNDEGRSFTGAHGDGELGASGDASVVGWPSAVTGLGVGFRGGTHFTNALELLQISGRLDASNEGAAPSRAGVYGWRGVRSAP